MALGGANQNSLWACALGSDGMASCWGNGASTVTSNMPSSAGPFSAISGNKDHVCAIYQATRRVVCWGTCPNKAYGSTNYQNTCEPDDPTTEFAMISANDHHTCGIRHSDSQIECWGTRSYGGGTDKLTGGSIYYLLTVPSNPPADGYSHISLGADNACAIERTSKLVTCWGNDMYGQSTPPNGQMLSSLSSNLGYFYACGIDATTSEAVCWGMLHTGNPFGAGVAVSQMTDWWGQRTCVIKADKYMTCTSNDWYAPPTDVKVTELVGGWLNSCWKKESGGGIACAPCLGSTAFQSMCNEIPAAFQR
jgi:hypothetical protein